MPLIRASCNNFAHVHCPCKMKINWYANNNRLNATILPIFTVPPNIRLIDMPAFPVLADLAIYSSSARFATNGSWQFYTSNQNAKLCAINLPACGDIMSSTNTKFMNSTIIQIWGQETYAESDTIILLFEVRQSCYSHYNNPNVALFSTFRTQYA